MPSWSVHLAVAKEVNKKLNLNKDLFYYGNLIPDVDKGTIINRYTAHFTIIFLFHLLLKKK